MVPIQSGIRSVLDIGACLSSRGHITDQRTIFKQTGITFIFLPIYRSHFPNVMNIDWYDLKYGEGASKKAINEQLYVGREDGASALDEIVRAQQEVNAPTDVIDLALMVGGQHMSRDDIAHSVLRLPCLLASGGKLIVRAPENPDDEEVGVEEIKTLVDAIGLKTSCSMGRQSTALDVVGFSASDDRPKTSNFRSIVFEKD